MKVGSTCPRCKREITSEIVAMLRKSKSDNARNSFRKAKERGSILGRRKTRDDDIILKLRHQGFTFREICQKSGFSFGQVNRSIRASQGKK